MHPIRSILALLVLCSFTQPAEAAKERLLYLYGDVAADGSVPSGDQPPFHQMRLNDDGNLGMSQFREALEAAGFQVEERYDAEVALNAEFLASWDVLVLGSNQRRFSQAEAEAVKQWVEAGGGVVAWSDSAFGGDYREVGADNPFGRDSDNDLMQQFGMHFMRDNAAGNYLITQFAEPHFLNRDNGLRFRGEGVSPVRVSPPARLLAPLQEGGLGGRLVLAGKDGKLDPATDAALAVAEIGKGRVVGVFDRNLFWNAGAGTRLSHSDNREFAQRLALWAAGSEDASRLDRPAKPNGMAMNPPRFEIQPEVAPDGSRIDLHLALEDPVGQPEFAWRVVKQPKEDGSSFENNNPNLQNARLLVTTPGTYEIAATVTLGEFRVQRKIKVVVPEE